jgi:(2Fe-2S) ferredoxin
VTDDAERFTVVVCKGPTCGDRRNSEQLIEHLTRTVAARGLGERIRVLTETCLGHCLRGPNILVQNEEQERNGIDGVLYNRMTVEDLERVIDSHLVGGMVVRPLMYRPPWMRDK